MIAKNNEFMQEATETLYELNADKIIRQQCLARQDYYRTQNAYKKRQKELERAYQEVTEEKEALLAEKETLLTKNESLLAEKAALQSRIDDKDRRIQELLAQIENKNKD